MHIWLYCLCAGVSESTVFHFCLVAARKLDGEVDLRLSSGQKFFWCLLCVGNSLLTVLFVGRMWGIAEREALLFGVASGGLLFACLTDAKCCKVYDFVWWLVLAAGTFLLWSEPERWSTVWGQFICFLLLQNFLFERFYGKADVYAFCACGLLESAFGIGFLGYFLHMAGAFLLLAIVQGLRHNIGADGNLKQPVPFLPYIVLSFWITLFF